jgi:nucleotide-binding universal stress UspA family protein
VLPRVSELARMTGARVVLLRVVEPRMMAQGRYAFPPGARLTEHDLIKSAHKYLTRIREGLDAEGIAVDEVVITGGRVPETIAQWAERNGADMVVMMSHGLGRAGRWVFGSVAEALLQVCSVPILVVKASRDVLEAQEEFEEDQMDRALLHEYGTATAP